MIGWLRRDTAEPTIEVAGRTLPVALLLISWLKRGKIASERWVQVIPFVLLGIGMGIVSIWWERFHQGTQGELFALSFSQRIVVASHAFWFYLGKLVWPVHLAFSYPRWPPPAGRCSLRC